jgi:hypothetical protein
MDKVEAYIENQKSPQKEILRRVREIFQSTLPSSEEEMKWGVVTFGGGKFYIAAMKSRVHVGFSINGLSSEEIKLFEGTGKTMRHIKIRDVESIDGEKLVELIKMVDKKAMCSA